MGNPIIVELDSRSYPIFIEKDTLKTCARHFMNLKMGKRGIIITNEVVSKWYLDDVYNSLKGAGINVEALILPDGEKTKSIEWLEKIYHEMLTSRLDRQSFVVALGGGVIGDLSGFAAATYMRGIPFVQVPTTLLAQVDSSVGGKTGINLAEGKNLVGAFYQPKMVIIDLSVMSTLDPRHFKAGFAEVIKYGIIDDCEFFRYLEDNLKKIMKLDKSCLETIVDVSCRIKASVVSKDEKESSIRAVLNFGHTVGHAVESVTKYDKLVHGEAVAIGMMVECCLGSKLLGFDEKSFLRVKNILKNSGLPYRMPEDISAESIIEHMKYDKKVKDDKIRIVLPSNIGEVQIVENVSSDDIIWAVNETKAII